jgi:5-methylcytosine-specific restriction protein A
MMTAITKDQYKEALWADGVLKERSIELLTTLFDAPSCRATAGQIAQMFGYPDFPPVNALIGKLGKRIASHLGIELQDRRSNSPGWWKIVATGEPTNEGFAWSLRVELFEALVELGLLVDRENQPFPETVGATGLIEGAVRKVAVNAYERNQTARRLCVGHHGAVCKVCEFDFERVYGAIGEGFIHVHHIVDLCQIGEGYQVDPINDLVPVCPNCHAMLHTRRPAMLVCELREILRATSSQRR